MAKRNAYITPKIEEVKEEAELEVIEIVEEFTIPNTDIILEVGDKIQVVPQEIEEAKKEADDDEDDKKKDDDDSGDEKKDDDSDDDKKKKDDDDDKDKDESLEEPVEPVVEDQPAEEPIVEKDAEDQKADDEAKKQKQKDADAKVKADSDAAAAKKEETEEPIEEQMGLAGPNDYYMYPVQGSKTIPSKTDDAMYKFTYNGPMLDPDFSESKDVPSMVWDAEFSVKGSNLVITGGVGPSGYGSVTITVPLPKSISDASYRFVLEPSDVEEFGYLKDDLIELGYAFETPR